MFIRSLLLAAVFALPVPSLAQEGALTAILDKVAALEPLDRKSVV